MSKGKSRQNGVGVIVPSIISTADIILSQFLKVLHSIADDIYVVGGSATPREYDQVKVYTIGYQRGTNILTEATNYLCLQFGISYRLARLSRNVDLWIFFLGREGPLLPMLTAKVLRKRIILAIDNLEKKGRAEQDILYRLLALAKKVNFSLSDKIVLFSERLIQEWDLEKHRGKISIANEHFLDFNSFKMQKRLDERGNYVGYIGRLSEEKGILNFLTAISELSKRNDSINFLIGGNGDLRSVVENYLYRENLTDKVTFVGWIPHDEIARYLNEFRLLVLPSYTEGPSYIIVEAMACGTPVLATRVGAIPDIVKDEETGFIMENNSPQCIVQNVERALSHPNLDMIANNAREFVKRNFAFATAVQGYRKIITELEMSQVGGDRGHT